MKGWRKQTSTSVGEGVEPIPSVRRRCGAMCVLSGMGRLALRQCFGANLAETKEQGKCRLSAKKALSISPMNCTDRSSVVETQLTLQPLDPASVVRDKQIYSYIPWADLPWLRTAVTRWALRKTVFCKSCTLALCLFALLSAFFCLLALRSLKGKRLSILENLSFSRHQVPIKLCFLCSKLPCSHLLVLSPEVKNHLQGNGGAH